MKSLLITLTCVSYLLANGCGKDGVKVTPTAMTGDANKTTTADMINRDRTSDDVADGKDTGMAKDLRSLRSLVAGVDAADRIFTRVQFVGMPKEHVLWMLGDPGNINEFGLPAGPGADDPLIYRVVGGAKTMDWAVLFKDGRVTKVERRASY